MKIAFLHYHLKTGGVTTVLRGQIAAIREVCDTLVLTGDRAGTAWPCEVVEIPEIGYDRPDSPPHAPQPVADKILKAISNAWPRGCDVLHVHNPTLAKNRCFLRVLNRLQQSGVPLFLQIHDFAEDGRPGAYFREPYPTDCHYGVINSRDREILLRAGLDPAGVHLVPNAIQPLPVEKRRPEPLVLYPIRAIRRKNLGEAILLSLFLQNGQRLDVSQPPNSPQDIASYRAWNRYVKEKRLNVNFDVGQKVDFLALVGAAAVDGHHEHYGGIRFILSRALDGRIAVVGTQARGGLPGFRTKRGPAGPSLRPARRSRSTGSTQMPFPALACGGIGGRGCLRSRPRTGGLWIAALPP